MRPTLEEQLKVRDMTTDECIEALKGKGLMRVDFWVFCHLNLLWSVIHWNWFCPFCGRDHIGKCK